MAHSTTGMTTVLTHAFGWLGDECAAIEKGEAMSNAIANHSPTNLNRLIYSDRGECPIYFIPVSVALCHHCHRFGLSPTLNK